MKKIFQRKIRAVNYTRIWQCANCDAL